MDGRINKWMDGWLGEMNEWVGGWMEECMNELMDEWIKE